MILLQSRDQLRSLSDEMIRQEGPVLSVESDAHHESTLRDSKSRSLWHYVRQERMTGNASVAVQWADRIADMCAGQFMAAGVDIVERTRNDLWYTLLYTLNVRDMIEGALQEYNPSRVVRFARHSDTMVRWNMEQPDNHFNAVAEWCANRHACESVVLQQPENPLYATRNIHATKRRVKEQFPCGLPTGDGALEGILILEGMLSGTELHALIKSLAPQIGKTWGLISSRDSGVAGGIAHLDDLMYLPHQELEQAGVSVGDRFLAWITNVFKSGACPVDDPILTSAELSGVWRMYAHGLTYCARCALAGRLLSRSLRPRVAVLSSTAFGPMRCLAASFQGEGVRVFSVLHTGFNIIPQDPLNRTKGEKTDVCVWGPYDREYVQLGAGGDVRIHEVGSFRLDTQRLVTKLAETVEPSTQGTRVVIFTTPMGFPIGYGSNADEYVKLWDELLAKADQFPAQPVLRPHPGWDQQDWYRDMIAGKNISMDQGPIEGVLKDAAVAVLLFSPSTVGLDAIAAGVPLIYLRQVAARSQRPLFLDGVLPVDSVDEMIALCHRLVRDIEYRSQVIRSQQAYVRRAIPRVGEGAVERFMAILQRIEMTASQAAEPAARWIVGTLSSIHDARYGHLSIEEWIKSWKRVGRRVADITAVRPYVDVDKIMSHLLRLVAWSEWRPIKQGEGDPVPARVITRTQVLCRLRRAPNGTFKSSGGWREFRNLLDVTLGRDISDAEDAGLSHGWMKIVRRGLAVSRLFKRATAT